MKAKTKLHKEVVQAINTPLHMAIWNGNWTELNNNPNPVGTKSNPLSNQRIGDLRDPQS